MKLKRIAAVIAAAIIGTALTGCGVSSKNRIDDLTEEEREWQSLREWFNICLKDEEEFPDMKDYQYYARTLGLDKDAFLSWDMWEVFYNENININRDVDGKVIFLIRLDPRELLEIYAENNSCTVDEICGELSLTEDQLYYNWGYTAAAVNYSKNHRDKKSAYSGKEKRIFGDDNGENRQTVMSTHFLTVDNFDGGSVSYSGTAENLDIRREDLLHITSKNSYDYSAYTDDEKNAAFTVNGIGIRYVLPLSVPNGWTEAEDKDITVMFNVSPFSYGCTDSDLLFIGTENEDVSETDIEETAETSLPDESSAISDEQTETSTENENVSDTSLSDVQSETSTEAVTETDIEEITDTSLSDESFDISAETNIEETSLSAENTEIQEED